MFLIRPALLTVVATVAAIGCSTSNEPGTLTLRNPSVVVEYFGGFSTDQRSTTLVDSASATWQRINCDPSISSSPCLRGTQVASGNVSSAASRSLFAAVHAPEFLTLPQVISGGTGPEADGVHTTLLVTVSGTRHIVQWNSGAPLPPALDVVMNALNAATK